MFGSDPPSFRTSSRPLRARILTRPFACTELLKCGARAGRDHGPGVSSSVISTTSKPYGLSSGLPCCRCAATLEAARPEPEQLRWTASSRPPASTGSACWRFASQGPWPRKRSFSEWPRRARSAGIGSSCAERAQRRAWRSGEIAVSSGGIAKRCERRMCGSADARGSSVFKSGCSGASASWPPAGACARGAGASRRRAGMPLPLRPPLALRRSASGRGRGR
mmetsp:Transcript_81837/g.265072  ORF Transcript_81837/g.265072 Transcript_81837/m.265072 type:complete len:222 (+) Transcript_81837:877-1542(+)